MNLQDTKETLIQRIETINDKAFLNALNIMTETKIEQSEDQLSDAEKQQLLQKQAKYTTCKTFTPEEIANDGDEWFEASNV